MFHTRKKTLKKVFLTIIAVFVLGISAVIATGIANDTESRANIIIDAFKANALLLDTVEKRNTYYRLAQQDLFNVIAKVNARLDKLKNGEDDTVVTTTKPAFPVIGNTTCTKVWTNWNIVINWTSVPNVTHYQLFATHSTELSPSLADTISSTTTTYTFSSPNIKDWSYGIHMRSINDSTFTTGGTPKPGTVSDNSNIATVNCSPNSVSTPSAPTNFVATPENSAASFSFNPVTWATSYVITCNSPATWIRSIEWSSSPIRLAQLTNNVTYTCTVVAKNSAWVSLIASATVTPSSNTTVNPINPVTPECTGTLPTNRVGVKVHPYSLVGGIQTTDAWNTEYKYWTTSCQWSCIEWYKQNGDEWCTPLAPGDGLTIRVLDKTTNQPIPWVTVEIIGSLSIAWSVTLLNDITDTAWNTIEYFWRIDPAYRIIITVKKSWYSLIKTETHSTLCSSVNWASCWLPYQYAGTDHVITIHMTTGAVVTTGSNPNYLFRIDKDPDRMDNYWLFYGSIGWTDVNNTTWCAEAESSSTCENSVNTWENLATRSDNAWRIVNGRLVASYPLSFPNWNYRFWIKNKTTNEVKNEVVTIGGTPPSASSTVQISDESVGNGSVVTQIKQSVYGWYSHLHACTWLAYDSNGAKNPPCNPTSDLQKMAEAGTDGWTYDGISNVYSINTNVSNSGYPYARYQSCFRPVWWQVQCLEFAPMRTNVSNESGCSFWSVAGPANPGACTRQNNWWTVRGYTCRCN